MNKAKISKRAKLITAAIGTFFLLISVLGLTESIMAGFAGFQGGRPFWIIAPTTVAMALFDFYDETDCKSKG